MPEYWHWRTSFPTSEQLSGVPVLGDQVWERFHQKDKKMHGWLYRQTAEVLRELEEYPAWQEYDRLIRRVFHEDFI